VREPARAVSQAAMAAIAAEMEELDAEAGRLDRAWEVRVCCRVLVTRGGGVKGGQGRAWEVRHAIVVVLHGCGWVGWLVGGLVRWAGAGWADRTAAEDGLCVS
jgi:hypothetical protein